MRVYNFSSGPAVLPESVLRKAADEMLCYGDTGMSVMEMSHRSKVYQEIIQEAEKLLRELMNIPDNYKVLFVQGGATLQFSAMPRNLLMKIHEFFVIAGYKLKVLCPERDSLHTGTVLCNLRAEP